MKSLDSSVHHLRSTSVLGDIHHLDSGISHSLSSTSSGENFNTVGFEELGKIHEASLIGDGEKSTLDLEERLGSTYSFIFQPSLHTLNSSNSMSHFQFKRS